MRLILALLLAMVAGGCGTTCPTFKLTRCRGSLLEFCGSNYKWQFVLDCATIKNMTTSQPSTWVCDATPSGCKCVPR